MDSHGIGLPIVPEGAWFFTEFSDKVAASKANFYLAAAAVVVRHRSTVKFIVSFVRVALGWIKFKFGC
jgi:hypothetical protein